MLFSKNALKHNRTTSGTTHLRDHMTHCLKNPSNQHSHWTTSRPITAFFKTPLQLSQSDQKKLLDASIKYIACNIWLFKAVEDPGFRNMADCLVQLDAKYGRFDENKALPSWHTVKPHAIQKFDEKQEKVINHLQSAVKRNGYVGITTCMWTDYSSRSYLFFKLSFCWR